MFVNGIDYETPWQNTPCGAIAIRVCAHGSRAARGISRVDERKANIHDVKTDLCALSRGCKKKRGSGSDAEKNSFGTQFLDILIPIK